MLCEVLRSWDRLRTLDHVEIASAYEHASEHVRDIATWRAAKLPTAITIAMLDEPAEVASGWAVRMDSGRCSLTRIGYHPDADDAWRQAIAPLNVENVASRFWSPARQ